MISFAPAVMFWTFHAEHVYLLAPEGVNVGNVFIPQTAQVYEVVHRVDFDPENEFQKFLMFEGDIVCVKLCPMAVAIEAASFQNED